MMTSRNGRYSKPLSLLLTLSRVSLGQRPGGPMSTSSAEVFPTDAVYAFCSHAASPLRIVLRFGIWGIGILIFRI